MSEASRRQAPTPAAAARVHQDERPNFASSGNKHLSQRQQPRREPAKSIASDKYNNNKRRVEEEEVERQGESGCSSIKRPLMTSGSDEQQQQQHQQQQQQQRAQEKEKEKKRLQTMHHSAAASCCCFGSSGSHRLAGVGGGDDGDEANQTDEREATPLAKSRDLKQVGCIVALMGLALTLAAILVALLAFAKRADDDQCLNQFAYQQPAYKLFATKTTYSTAYQYLAADSSKLPKPGPELLGGSRPGLFSSEESLAAINQRLQSDEGCTLRQLHYIGRHAARFPSLEETQRMNQLIKNVQARIDLSKFQSPAPTQPNKTTTTTSLDNTTTTTNSANTTVCSNPLTQYKQWATFMRDELANTILDTGAAETRAIATRLKSIYPEMFDDKRAEIEIGVTDKERTSQTALIFMKLLENFEFKGCDLRANNNNNSDGKLKEPPQTKECYDKIEKQFLKKKLMFHKECQFPKSEKRATLNSTEFIASSLNKKLKLADKASVSVEEAKAIYDVCKYESAFMGSTSIWCNLFTDNELKFYEYLEDIDDYFNTAYGDEKYARSACPVTNELLKSFGNAASDREPKANFYFTHSEAIQKILAASIDLEGSPDFDEATIKEHLKGGTVPNDRQWRTSLFTPFSANLAFALYNCPSQKETNGVRNFNTAPYKVVASLNEQPIMLQGCDNYDCNLNLLTSESRLNRLRLECQLTKICPKYST